jgi:hypothetical protein
MFFKKQKPAEQPRERQRPAIQTPQMTSVFSYHASRASTADPRGRHPLEQQEKPLARKRPRRLPKLKTIGTVLAIFAVFFLVMNVDTNPKVVVLGDDNSIFLQGTAQYKQTAQQLLARSVLNANKLTINAAPIVQGLEAQYPEVHTATVALSVFGRQPTVYIQPAEPQLILATQHNGQFVLDSSGRALVTVTKKTPLPTGAHALPIVTDESGLEVKAGDTALPKQSVMFITEVAGQFKAKQLTMSAWRLPAQASELDASVSGTPYYVRFNLQGDAREQAGTYLATKNYLDSKNIKPAQYVDVRVSGRSYYK